MITISRKNKLEREREARSKDLAEIHQYTLDIQEYIRLRNACMDAAERERYNTTIKIMQLALIRLNHTIGVPQNGRLISLEK